MQLNQLLKLRDMVRDTLAIVVPTSRLVDFQLTLLPHERLPDYQGMAHTDLLGMAKELRDEVTQLAGIETALDIEINKAK